MQEVSGHKESCKAYSKQTAKRQKLGPPISTLNVNKNKGKTFILMQ